MTRYPDWKSRLWAYVADQAAQPFRPGKHDCALFAAGAVRVMTGRDLARGYRSTYRSLAKGRTILAERGYADMTDLAAAHFEEIPPIFARAGDLAVLEDAEGATAFGVVQGARIYVLHPSGLATVPLTDAKRAFRV